MMKLFDARAGHWIERKRPSSGDPMARQILWDIVITTAGFVMVVIAVVLTVQGLSIN
jgi:hypothetical protein